MTDIPYEVDKSGKFFSQQSDYIVWLGHASFLMQIDGKRLITDPCLTSPVLTKRYIELPVDIESLKPDYLLISHGHMDHLDSTTMKYFSHATALTPLRMTDLVKGMNPSITVQEAGWYQKYDIDENFSIYLLPAKHWYKRTAFDTNEILWGSFVIKTASRTIYFAGDTAYDTHFKKIGKLFDIDVAILPIAAYAPRWFMKDNHMSPEDSKKAFKDLKAKKLLPMHFGTFDLSNEPTG